MSTVDILIIIGFIMTIVITLYKVKLKHVSINEYYIYGRKLSSFNLAVLWAVAWVGGASTLGLVANVYHHGVSAFWYVFAVAFGTLLFALLLAPRIRKVGDKLNQVTFADIIEDRYDVRCRILVTVINLLTFILYTASQIVAISYVLELTGLFSLPGAIIAGTLLFALYTARGGLTYILRVAYLFALVIISGGLILTLYSTQFMGLKDSLMSMPGGSWDMFGWGWHNIVLTLVAITCTCLTSSDGYMRCLASRDERSTKSGLLLASFLIIVMTAAFLLIGLYTRLHFTGPLTNYEILGLLWLEMPHAIKGVLVVTILAVILSTADISLMVAAANMSKDIYNRFIHVRASQEVLLKASYLSAAFIAVLAGIIALVINDIFIIIMWAFKITTISLTVPVLGAYFWPRGQANSAFYSMVASLTITGIWIAFKLNQITGIDVMWAGLSISMMVFFAHSLLVKQDEECFRKSQAYCRIKGKFANK